MPSYIRLGSDDGLAVWLNGEQLLARDVARGAQLDQDRVRLSLRTGENRLLLKIFNRGGQHGFAFSFEDIGLHEIWRRLEQEFPVQMGWMQRVLQDSSPTWFRHADDTEMERQMIDSALDQLRECRGFFQGEYESLCDQQAMADDVRWLQLFERIQLFDLRPDAAKRMNLGSLRRAIQDLSETFGVQYARGAEFLDRLEDLQQATTSMETAIASGDSSASLAAPTLGVKYEQLHREALLANPLMTFDRLLFIRRKADRLGLPQNWQGNCALSHDGYDNEIAVLSPVAPGGDRTVLYRPSENVFVGDIDLHFDADRMLFSMPGGEHGRWQIWELNTDGTQLRQVTLGDEPDVDNYDACYPYRCITPTPAASNLCSLFEESPVPLAPAYAVAKSPKA